MAARHNRRRRRRGRFSFLYKLLSVVLIVCAIVAGSVIFFRVEEITVSGSTVYSSDEIIAASEVAVGDNLFLVGRPSTSTFKVRRSAPSSVQKDPGTAALYSGGQRARCAAQHPGHYRQ